METQKFKSVNLRTIVMNALHGKPINVHSCELFDLEPVDVDDQRTIVCEFDDDMEVLQAVRDIRQEKFDEAIKGKSSQKNNDESDNKKGGIEDESQTQTLSQNE